MNAPLHRLISRTGAVPRSDSMAPADATPQAAARWLRALASLFAASAAPARVMPIPAGAMDPTAALLWWTGDADRLAWIELSQPLQPGADPLLRNVRAALRLAARLPASWSQGHPLIWADGAACRAACASIEDPLCLQVEVPGLRLRLWGARDTLAQWPDVVPDEQPTPDTTATVIVDDTPEVAPAVATAEVAPAVAAVATAEVAPAVAPAVAAEVAEVAPAVAAEVAPAVTAAVAAEVAPAVTAAVAAEVAVQVTILEAAETLVHVRPTPAQLEARVRAVAVPEAPGGATTHVMDRNALDHALDALRGGGSGRQKQETAR